MNILIVDADDTERPRLAAALQAHAGVHVDSVPSGPAALDRMGAWRYDGIVAARSMSPMDGIELVRRIRRTDPALPVVLLAAGAGIDDAVEAMRAGATDFLPKAVDPLVLLRLLRRDAAGDDTAPPPPSQASPAPGARTRATAADYIVGRHPLLDGIRNFAERLASVPEARVLITGESGTGKSALARAIHELAGGTGRFVEVSCATLPPSLIESELFGHEKGAFTDARTMKRGLVETASGGTLFLDEIGTLPLDMQTKLLVFLESRQIRRVGGNTAIETNARVVAATNEDLREAVRAGRFRSDLLYRLDVASVRMPSLRSMPEVIPDLAARFTSEIAAQFRRKAPPIGAASLRLMMSYAWPGNARELRNALERAMIFHDAGPLEIQVADHAEIVAPADGLLVPRGLTLDDVERLYILDTMQRHDGDLTSLAAQLGISRKTLWDKRRRYSAAPPPTARTPTRLGAGQDEPIPDGEQPAEARADSQPRVRM
jgi:two-component system, NtrC family, response regulator AtoC